jgi:cyclic nucleotide gated channel, plant
MNRIFGMILMLIGVMSYSFAIGSLSSALSSYDKREGKLKERLSTLNDIKKQYNINTELFVRLTKALKYDHSKNVVDKFDFLKELPQNLKLELSYLIHKDIINMFTFFKNKPRDFMSYCGPLLRPVKILKGEYIYVEGDPIDEIYFLIKGQVAMVLKKYSGDIPYVSIDPGTIIVSNLQF